MRELAFGLLCGACLFGTACNSNPGGGPQPPVGAMTVDPDKIVSEPGNIRTLHGEFAIRAAKPNETSISPAALGGSCLIARVPVEGKSCSTQAECDIQFPGQPAPPNGTGYCLGPDQLPTTQNGTCWVKPSDQDYCRKQLGAGNHVTPTTDTSPVYAYVAQQSPHWRRPVDWVLLGCLNGSSSAPQPPCKSGVGPHIYVASHVRPVP